MQLISLLLLSPVVFAQNDPMQPIPAAPPIKAFKLDTTPVTVAAFATFVRKTGHVTTAERLGGSVMTFGTGAWRIDKGATWRKPHDGEAAIATHPVTQVSWHDAVAYCRAQGKRLPTGAEFEHATGKTKGSANVWTGVFPFFNDGKDGYTHTAPVKAFPANGRGLYGMVATSGSGCKTILAAAKRCSAAVRICAMPACATATNAANVPTPRPIRR